MSNTRPTGFLNPGVLRPLFTYRSLLMAAALATFLLLVMGSVVRVNDASHACPDWPTCYGHYGFPEDYAAQLQYIHRGLAALAGALVLSAALLAKQGAPGNPWVSRPLYLSVVFIISQSLLGSRLALAAPEAVLPVAHQTLALFTLLLVTLAAATTFLRPANTPSWRWPAATFARLAAWTLLALLVLMSSGALLANSPAANVCNGWPLCDAFLPQSAPAWLAAGHRLLTALVSLLILAQTVRAWRSQRSQVVILSAASAVFILFIGQVLFGAVKVLRAFPPELVWLHAATAVALWAVQAILVQASLLADRSPQEEAGEAAQPLPLRRRFGDFLLLSKPIIVALLLVTTYAGMVVGGQQLPGAALTFWTMLGGALAAGGASALNQYIDRELDKNMQRTARRPLPAGRLTPAEGLAFGIGACLLAFILLASMVNLLAALLSLAGMIYYVLLYSIWLKHVTVQNIVIGGGAGAIPPLVGWAAASGSLNVPALFLFAIVFLWTPPHFWALALVRRNDYARAGVPMLPVVRGEKETRTQIFIYTLELVVLTLLMPVLNITGSLFLVSAIVLGGLLILAAWRVLRRGGNKTAYRMYRYSSMYLAFLFLALVLDVLV